MNHKDQVRRFNHAVEDYAVDLTSAVMDSFAARIRDQARLAPDPVTLLAVAACAEEVAAGVREDLAARRRSAVPQDVREAVAQLMKIKDGDEGG